MKTPAGEQSRLGKRRWREIVIVFVVMVLLAATYPFEILLENYYEKTWSRLRTENAESVLLAAENRFSGEQRSVRRIAAEISQHADVAAYLSGGLVERVRVFDVAERFASDYDVGVEVYDRHATLVAWHGLSGPEQRREVSIALDGQMTSYVTQTRVASQLFIALPVRSSGRILGAVVVRKTLDVHYPFSNRFVTQEGITAQVARELGTPVRFDFSARLSVQPDTTSVSRLLYGIDSSVVGSVRTDLASQTASVEKIGTTFDSIRSILLIGLLIALMMMGGRLLLPRVNAAVEFWISVAFFWLIRYVLLWTDIPSGLIGGAIFDPIYFASKFGGGLAKSLGEMTLTILTFGVTLVLFLRWWYRSCDRWEAAWSRLPSVLRIPISIVTTFFLFWFLRGYGAVVRSAVFDSTLPYYEPTTTIPALELSLMLFNLLILGSGMAVVGIIMTRFHVHSSSHALVWYGITALLYGVATVLFGVYQDEPLMSAGYRAVAAFLFLLGAWYVGRRRMAQASPLAFGTFAGVLAVAAILLYPLLSDHSAERDQSRVEQFAAEVLRPVDHWFTFVVDEGVQMMRSAREVVDILQGRAPEPDQTVFGLWARSAACREGYTSVFEVLDLDGRVRGRFAIGSQTSEADLVLNGIRPDTNPLTRVKTLGEGTNAVNVYAGSSPLLDSMGTPIGLVRVAIAAGRQALFRGENPAILRGTSKETLDDFYRMITISEFRGGLISSSTNEAIPLNHPLPQEVRTAFSDERVGGIWVTERFLDKGFETLYLRKGGSGNDVIALSMEERGLVWDIIGAVKILVVLLIILCIVGGAALGVRYARNEVYHFTFRDRLLMAFLATAIVPFGVLLWYGQTSARERLEDVTAQRLEQQTERIAQEIREYMERGEITIDGAVLPDIGDRIATAAGADFNLYLDNRMTVTSRPELYSAGLLDARVSGGAFAMISLLGQRFYAESEHIGRYRYAVGYRPVLDRGGAVIGIVSVPTLYRQDEVERENAARNALLYAVYAIVLLGVVLLTTLLANRIAAPIIGLTRVTKKVAKGDLDISKELPAADGEIGELVRSFDVMTQDLRRSRDTLLRVERELAWKEMARQVAHEIKNPLTPMRLMVQHLRQTYRDNVSNFAEILQQVTQTIVEQIDTLTRIASEFSSFARMPKGNPVPCDVSSVLSEAVALFDQEKGVHFVTSLDEALPPVMADREELRRAFINIIRNGIQAMNGNGKMEIRSQRKGVSVLISIRDHGTGIPDDVKAKLFQPNFSTKTDGMGLGLAIVKKTIDDLDGTIVVESTVGRGTTVSILLPSLRDQS